MKMRLLIALALLASAAWAGPIFYIDTFDLTQQAVCSTGGAIPCVVLNSTVNAPEAVGGVRTMHLNPIIGSVMGSVSPPSASYLSFSQDVASSAILDVVWDAGGSGLGLDLTAGHGEWFMMRVHSDLGMSGVLTLVTMVASAPTSSSATFTIPASAAGVWEVVYVPFSAFVGDLTQTRSIDLTLDGTSHVEADSAVDYLGIETPEPGSLLLIGGGLLALNLLRRRVRRA